MLKSKFDKLKKILACSQVKYLKKFTMDIKMKNQKKSCKNNIFVLSI